MMLVILDASEASRSGAGFSATVSVDYDGCVGDPCHGAPCTSTPGSNGFTCQPTGKRIFLKCFGICLDTMGVIRRITAQLIILRCFIIFF